jgi:hypothetical protein
MNSTYEGMTNSHFVHYESPYELKGKTYREFLVGLESTAEKLLFEMRSYSRGVIYDMLSFPADRRFYSIKLEDISRDPQMTSLENAFIHLNFEGNDLSRCLDIASQNCLWKIGMKGIETHATTGMSEDWRDAFTGDVEREYRKLFGWAEEGLGYHD